jgi:hypothetical protein
MEEDEKRINTRSSETGFRKIMAAIPAAFFSLLTYIMGAYRARLIS